ncbi:MAG: SHOCT domain-containing protein, partial [Cutibacterium avidum]|nr:SHOCT domain-containing protein [Cutibacterium avidum]
YRRWSMRVEKFEGRQEIIKTEYLERDLKAELNFYLSDKFIQDLFLLDEISLEEYRKIRRENIKRFRPILSELLL